MILVEEYQNDFEKGSLSFNLKPKYSLSYYEGSYGNVEFEIVDGDGIYPTIQWIEEFNFINPDIKEIEDGIIKEFIKQKYK